MSDELAHISTTDVSDSAIVPTVPSEYMQVYYMFKSINPSELSRVQNCIQAIRAAFAGSPGAGLTSGTLSDTFITGFLKSILLPGFTTNHKDEADGKCGDILFSIKTICSEKGSDLALDWSKNRTESTRERFTCPICLIVLNTSKWWNKLAGYNDTVRSGFYFVDPSYCKENITLSSNNKTNALISRKQVYQMIQYAKSTDTHIQFPDDTVSCRFDILSAFVSL